MKIDNRESGDNIIIRGIEGDMGEDTQLSLLQQPDGDVIVVISDMVKHQLFSIEFCTSNGGGRRPIIAKKLRELIAELVKL
jgi:hypothetical protein